MDRDTEAEMLSRCTAVAMGDLDQVDQVKDAYEAKIFDVAGMVLQSRMLPQSQRLRALSAAYFKAHPDAHYDLAVFCRQPDFPSLPRLRDMLTASIHHKHPGTRDGARGRDHDPNAKTAETLRASAAGVDVVQVANVDELFKSLRA
jgi:hypothetical protein